MEAALQVMPVHCTTPLVKRLLYGGNFREDARLLRVDSSCLMTDGELRLAIHSSHRDTNGRSPARRCHLNESAHFTFPARSRPSRPVAFEHATSAQQLDCERVPQAPRFRPIKGTVSCALQRESVAQFSPAA